MTTNPYTAPAPVDDAPFERPTDYGSWRRLYGRPMVAPPMFWFPWWVLLAPLFIALFAYGSGRIGLRPALTTAAIASIALHCLEGPYRAARLRLHLQALQVGASTFVRRFVELLERGTPDVEAVERVIEATDRRDLTARLMRDYIDYFRDYVAYRRANAMEGDPPIETLLADFTQVDFESPTPTADQLAACRDIADRFERGEWASFGSPGPPPRVEPQPLFPVVLRQSIMLIAPAYLVAPWVDRSLRLGEGPAFAVALVVSTLLTVGEIALAERAKRMAAPPAEV